MKSSSQPTSDERILAAVAHASVLLAFLGPVIPAVLWTTQRRKSQYAAYHALQAMGYQTIIFWVWILLSMLLGILLMLMVVILEILSRNPSSLAETWAISEFVVFLTIFGIGGFFILVGILGGALCLMGRNFRYPLLGGWLWKYLTGGQAVDQTIAEDKEDNWVSGMCHASAILFIWGIFLPLIIWLTHQGRTARLHFQSLQALVYQGIAAVVYIIGVALYFIGFFAMMFMAIAGGMLTSPPGSVSNSPASLLIIIFLVFFFIIWLFWIILILLLPLFHLFAFIAAVRVIRGHDYRYPILGKWLAGRLAVG